VSLSNYGGTEYAEPFDTLRVIGFPPFMVSQSNHANSACLCGHADRCLCGEYSFTVNPQ